MKKRALWLLAVMVALVAVLILPASAATIVDSGTCGGNLTWTLDSDGVLTISGTGEMRDYHLGGAPWYSQWEAIKRVEITAGVTSIGSAAFYGCSSLTAVDIPASVTSIGSCAFEGCSSLTDVSIPEGVTSIESYAFYECSSLTTVSIPAGVTSIGESAFEDCSSLTTVTIPTGMTSIERRTFHGCSSLTTVSIPASVTSIGYGAFCGCSTLTTVTIPAGVTSIGDYAFSGCSSLTTVSIPAGVTSIGDYALEDCSSLTDVTIPAGVTSIGGATFSGCSSLTTVSLPASVTSIGNAAFYGCSSLTDVSIPAGVTSIGSYAFYRCSSLTTVNIPAGVTSIVNHTFYGCSSLTTVSIPASVTSIGSSAFSGCSSLTTVTIPAGVTSIEWYTFYECSSLTSVDIPASVTSIGSYAFSDCSSLTAVTIPAGVTSIGNGTFYGCSSLTEVTIPAGVTSIGSSAFSRCSSLTEVTIPASVTSIGYDAFYDCDSLTAVTIPAGVTSIGEYAFYGCRLTGIIIPASVASIGKYTFDSGIRAVLYGGTETQWEEYGLGGGFDGSPEIIFNTTTPPQPKITSQPVYTTVDGRSFKLSVGAQGAGLSYGWKRRKSPEEQWSAYYHYGDSDGTSSVYNDYRGYQFRCVITDAFGVQLISNTITLPGIITQPQSVTVGATQKASFTVEAVGDGLLYQWQYREPGSDNWTNNGCTTAALTFDPAGTFRGGYQYRCIITDNYGYQMISNGVTLTVVTRATITGWPRSVTVAPDETATFTVTAAGDGLTYQWQCRTPADGTWFNNGVTTPTLTFSPAGAFRDGYQYRCIVTDKNGNRAITSAVTLTVRTELAITGQPQSVTVGPDEKAVFTVTAKGDGLTYQWQYRTSAAGTWANNWCTSATMTFDPAGASRNGYQYRCIITDKRGNQAVSNVATLTVLKGPEIITQPRNVTTTANGVAVFTVVAEGEGLTYQWQYRPNANSKWYSNAFTTATMTFNPAENWRNGYQYRCIVTDRNGSSVTSNIATLTIQAPASTVTITAQPRNVTTTANGVATFTVEAEGEGLTYQWQYRPNANGKWYNNAFTTATMTFNPAAQWRNGYQYRCVVTDRNGSSVTSEIATLTIQAAAPAVVITTQPRNVTTTANGVAVFTVAAEGEGLTYQWQYRSSAGGKWYDNAFTTATMTFNPAAAWRNGYQYRCVVTDRNGNSVISDAATLTVN